jgi:hypothetical protein
LPITAVHFDEHGHSYVQTVDSARIVQQVDVTTGFEDGASIEIVSGLSGDERVVASARGRIVPGQPVDVSQ